MRPTLFHIGSHEVPSFFFMIMIAALACTYVAVKLAKREGLSEVAILDMAIIAVIGSVVGSRLFFIIVEAPEYFLEDLRRVYKFWEGGYVSLGAFIASILGWIIYLRIKRLNVPRYLDIGAMIAPVAEFFVRIGCLLTGCCYGRPTDLPFGIIFTDPASPAYRFYPGVPLHPTQIYNMINSVIMFGILYFVYKKRKFYGQVGAVFLMYYAVTRFFIEFLRAGDERVFFFAKTFTAPQVTMIVTLFLGIVLYIILGRGQTGADRK